METGMASPLPLALVAEATVQEPTPAVAVVEPVHCQEVAAVEAPERMVCSLRATYLLELVLYLPEATEAMEAAVVAAELSQHPLPMKLTDDLAVVAISVAAAVALVPVLMIQVIPYKVGRGALAVAVVAGG